MIASLLVVGALLRTEIPETRQADFLPLRTFTYTTKLVLGFSFLLKVLSGFHR